MNLNIVILPAKVLADGSHKIRIAMSHNGNTRYFNTRFTIPLEKNLKNGKIVGKEVTNSSYINLKLSEMTEQIYKAYDNIQDSDYYSCSQLMDLIKAQLSRQRLKAFDAIAEDWLEIKKRQNKEGSIKLYEMAIDLFKEFAGSDYVLSLLTLQKVYQYESWIEKEKKLGNTTLNMRMRVLRAIVHHAIKRKYVTYDLHPFEGYREKQETIRDVAIPVETFRKLRDLEGFSENVMIVRDMFLLSFYLCGINLADMMRIKLSGDSVSFNRTKTVTRRSDGLVEFTIQPEARKIIDKYITPDGTIAFKGKKDLRAMNNLIKRNLDDLHDAIECEGRLIYYSMRKTFAQTANELGVQERVIAYCLGDAYRDNESILSYYISTKRKMADDAIRKVFDFVNSDIMDPEPKKESNKET